MPQSCIAADLTLHVDSAPGKSEHTAGSRTLFATAGEPSRRSLTLRTLLQGSLVNVPYERHLRDQLAQRLDLIESGLRLIETEYAMPNASGTRGRIDILARDGHNSWVVIELKRADGTARQALHEVTKYTALLCQERGLRPDRIRAVIVSTTWQELLVPVSNLARDWSHDLRGYQLLLDAAGTPTRADRVTLLPPPTAPRVTPHHFIYFFDSPEDRDQGWQQIVDRGAEAGANDILAADFQRVRDLHLVRAPYGLYFALGQMQPDAAPHHIKAACEDLDEEADDYALEYEALCHITHITGHVFAADYDSARPGVLRHLEEDPCWTIEGYRAVGAFDKRSLLGDRDLLHDLNGEEDGIGEILYSGSARTTDRGRWPIFLQENKRSLGGNHDWDALIHEWLADVASHPFESDVFLHVYNPCDLIYSFLHGWPDDLQRRVPMLSGTAINQNGPHRSICGSLYWNGDMVPDIAERLRRIYREPLEWSIARVTGASWEFDLQLTEELNLRYLLIERIRKNPLTDSDRDQVNLWTVQNGTPKSLSAPYDAVHDEGWPGVHSFDSFIDQHRAQIDSLVMQYRHSLAFQPQ